MENATSRTDPPRGKRQLSGLDVIRFAAAVIVFFHHLGFWVYAGFGLSAGAQYAAISYRFLAPYAAPGWVGVEVFFVLSGFVIAYSAQTSTAIDFLRNRAVRLYPAAVICSTLTLFFFLWSGYRFRDLWVFWLHSMFLLPWWVGLESAYWTLGLEIAFYGLIFFLLLLRRFRWVLPVMSMLGIGSAACWTLYLAEQTGSLQRFAPATFFTRHFLSPLSQSLLLQHGVFFAIGVLLYFCLLRQRTPGRMVALLICLWGGSVEIWSHAREINRAALTHFSWHVPWTMWLLSLALIILSVWRSEEIGNVLGQRGAAAARVLGLITYPLYLLHQMIGYFVLARFHGRLPDLLTLGLLFPAMVVAAYAVNRFGEVPLQRGLRIVLGGRRRAPVASSAP